RGIALHDEDLRDARVLARAVGELARHAARLEQALTTRGLPGLSSREARGRGLDRLANDVLRASGVALEPVAELVPHDLLHERLRLRVAQLGLRLPLELRLAELHRDDGGEALAHVISGEIVVLLAKN